VSLSQTDRSKNEVHSGMVLVLDRAWVQQGVGIGRG